MVGSATNVELLAAMMDAASMRHRAIAHNIANVNTPNYHRVEVAFEEELTRSLHRGTPISKVQPQIIEGAAGDSMRMDGNTVDIDREMGDLTKNNLLYSAAAQILANRIATMRSAITGR
jgi:flagellar basal-body rod protein FlgB